jgi:predicted 3-demethylubiquinone-9 3-methyltransferase (glyoxalase superfamily)
MAQKITPSLWVETTDAMVVAEYELSIFKDGRLKSHNRYQNPL